MAYFLTKRQIRAFNIVFTEIKKKKKKNYLRKNKMAVKDERLLAQCQLYFVRGYFSKEKLRHSC